MENSNHFNVIVIGAGISGIGAGYYLKKNCPNKSFCIIEGRENICLLYTSPSPRDQRGSRMPSSA